MLWGIAADFSKVEEINALSGGFAFGNILVNNAGIFKPKLFAEIHNDDWFRLFDIM